MPQRCENLKILCNFKVKDSTRIRLIQSFIQASIIEIVDFRSVQINRKGTTALSNDQLF